MIPRDPLLRAGLLSLCFPLALVWDPLAFLLLVAIVWHILIALKPKPKEAPPLSVKIAQHHPYVGWYPMGAEIGGEAAAMGLVGDLPVWDDDEVSVNLNGSVAHLEFYDNTGVSPPEKPKTFTGIE